MSTTDRRVQEWSKKEIPASPTPLEKSGMLATSTNQQRKIKGPRVGRSAGRSQPDLARAFQRKEGRRKKGGGR